jgi:hypothetical protein
MKQAESENCTRLFAKEVLPRLREIKPLTVGSFVRRHSMQRRRLGQLEVSAVRLGCGTMTPFYGEPDRAAGIATIRRAREIGVDLLDTADGYGRGRNEKLVGEAVRGHRGDYVIASKFGNLGQTSPMPLPLRVGAKQRTCSDPSCRRYAPCKRPRTTPSGLSRPAPDLLLLGPAGGAVGGDPPNLSRPPHRHRDRDDERRDSSRCRDEAALNENVVRIGVIGEPPLEEGRRPVDRPSEELEPG